MTYIGSFSEVSPSLLRSLPIIPRFTMRGLVVSISSPVEWNANRDIVSVVVRQITKCILLINGVPNGNTPAMAMKATIV